MSHLPSTGCRPALAVLASLAASALVGCGDDLPSASFVDKLRVLAVRAEPPEVAPGQTTRLDALAVEPSRPAAATAPLSALWLVCRLPPGVSSPLPCGLAPGELDGTTLPPRCDAGVTGDLCVLSTSPSADLRPAATLLGERASETLLVTVAVADTGAGAAACLLEAARHDGLPQEPDRCVISIKRLTVRDPLRADAGPDAPNRNPTLDRFDLLDEDGSVRSLMSGTAQVPPSVDDPVERKLTTVRSERAAEQKADGTYEALSLSWFTTGGKIDGGRSTFDPPGCASQEECASTPPVTGADTTWETPTAARAADQADADGRIHFWAVLRDDRGGVGWIEGVLAVK